MTSGKNREKVQILITATVLNFLLNLFAIHEYGMMGAAAVSLLTNIFVAGVGYIFVSRQVRQEWTYGTRYSLPFLATVGLTYVLYWLRDVPIVYTVAPAALCCAIVIFIVGYTSSERKAILALKGNEQFA